MESQVVYVLEVLVVLGLAVWATRESTLDATPKSWVIVGEIVLAILFLIDHLPLK